MHSLFLFLLSCTEKATDTSSTQTCSNVLSDEEISRLQITLTDHIAMQAGWERTLEMGTIECCVYIEPVDACVEWSVSPSEGASIDETGVLRIDESIPHGTVFTVVAKLRRDGIK